jgi:hypothetical protein
VYTGADPATVKKYARKLGLQTFWEERNNGENSERTENKAIPDEAHKREQYRNAWILLQQQYPEKGKKELRLICKSVYTWLYRNDRQWLNDNSPQKRYVYVNKRVDWEQRDQELLSKVKNAVQELLDAEDKPKRISISSIGSMLGVRALLEKHLDKLPTTKAYIESVAESDKDFRIRRVQWAIKALEEEHQEVKAWRILKKAGIREEFVEEVREIIEGY